MNQNSTGFLDNIPLVTRNLLIINVLVFLADSLLSTDGTLVKYLALHFFESKDFMPHQLITYMFMHGDIMHIFFNMFMLFMFGRTLETMWGPKRFLTYYLLTGMGAALLHVLISYGTYYAIVSEIPADKLPDMLAKVHEEGAALLQSKYNFQGILGSLNAVVNVPMLGASGGVYGLLVAFGMLFPDARMFVIPFPFPIKAKYLVGGLAVIALISGISNRAGDNVAHFAHLGGFLTGMIIILYWKKKGTANGKFF